MYFEVTKFIDKPRNIYYIVILFIVKNVLHWFHFIKLGSFKKNYFIK